MEPTQAIAKTLEGGNLASLDNLEIAMSDTYAKYRDAAHAIANEAKAVVVTDPTQVKEIKQSRALRLSIRAVRVEAENKRKELKAVALKVGRIIDSTHAELLAIIDPVETRLAEQEKIAERMEAERKLALGKKRYEQIRPFGIDPYIYRLDEISEEQFQKVLADARASHEKRLADAQAAAEAARVAEEERQAEAARLEAEALAERGRRMAAEREAARQKAEAEKFFAEEKRRRDAELAAQQAVALQEREAREKLEREAQALRDAEAAKKRAEEEAARKAAAAPDKEKLLALAKEIRNYSQTRTTTMKTPAAAEILGYAIFQLGVLASAIENRARAL